MLIIFPAQLGSWCIIRFDVSPVSLSFSLLKVSPLEMSHREVWGNACPRATNYSVPMFAPYVEPCRWREKMASMMSSKPNTNSTLPINSRTRPRTSILPSSEKGFRRTEEGEFLFDACAFGLGMGVRNQASVAFNSLFVECHDDAITRSQEIEFDSTRVFKTRKRGRNGLLRLMVLYLFLLIGKSYFRIETE